MRGMFCRRSVGVHGSPLQEIVEAIDVRSILVGHHMYALLPCWGNCQEDHTPILDADICEDDGRW